VHPPSAYRTQSELVLEQLMVRVLVPPHEEVPRFRRTNVGPDRLEAEEVRALAGDSLVHPDEVIGVRPLVDDDSQPLVTVRALMRVVDLVEKVADRCERGASEAVVVVSPNRHRLFGGCDRESTSLPLRSPGELLSLACQP
jgi:hypothetical protein